MVRRNINALSEEEYNHVWAEYGKFINASKISNGDDAIADVWNEHNREQVPDTKRGERQNVLLTDDDIILSMSNNISKNLKKNFRTTNRNTM